MENIILVVHLIVAVAMILLILIQRTAQDGGGLMGGGGTMGGVFTARGGANAMTRATAILATIFICTSLGLTYIASQNGAAHNKPLGIIDSVTKQAETPAAPVGQEKADAQKPAEPKAPAVPMAP